MNEVGAALLACWTPPVNSQNSAVALSFSLKRLRPRFSRPRNKRQA
jgi:hypothetical protein